MLHNILSDYPDGLPLQDCYRAIKTRYPYFMYNVESKGWESSVRHNLNQVACFLRVEENTEPKRVIWKLDKNIPLAKETKRSQKRAEPAPQPQSTQTPNNIPTYGQQAGRGYPYQLPPNFQRAHGVPVTSTTASPRASGTGPASGSLNGLPRSAAVTPQKPVYTRPSTVATSPPNPGALEGDYISPNQSPYSRKPVTSTPLQPATSQYPTSALGSSGTVGYRSGLPSTSASTLTSGPLLNAQHSPLTSSISQSTHVFTPTVSSAPSGTPFSMPTLPSATAVASSVALSQARNATAPTPQSTTPPGSPKRVMSPVPPAIEALTPRVGSPVGTKRSHSQIQEESDDGPEKRMKEE